MTTDVQVWREVLAPTSKLINQSFALSDALKYLDMQRARPLVLTAAEEMTPETRHLVNGMLIYLDHMAATNREQHDLATEYVRKAREEFGNENLDDLRRLGNLVWGLALERLYKVKYAEAHELAWSVLEPAAAEALMSKIALRRLTPSQWIKSRLNMGRQILSMVGERDMPIIWRLPKRLK